MGLFDPQPHARRYVDLDNNFKTVVTKKETKAGDKEYSALKLQNIFKPLFKAQRVSDYSVILYHGETGVELTPDVFQRLRETGLDTVQKMLAALQKHGITAPSTVKPGAVFAFWQKFLGVTVLAVFFILIWAFATELSQHDFSGHIIPFTGEQKPGDFVEGEVILVDLVGTETNYGSSQGESAIAGNLYFVSPLTIDGHSDRSFIYRIKEKSPQGQAMLNTINSFTENTTDFSLGVVTGQVRELSQIEHVDTNDQVYNRLTRAAQRAGLAAPDVYIDGNVKAGNPRDLWLIGAIGGSLLVLTAAGALFAGVRKTKAINAFVAQFEKSKS